MDKVTGQCPQATTFLKRKESRSGIEPRSFCLPAERLTARPNRLTETLSGSDSVYSWSSGKALGCYAVGLRFNSASALLSLQKSCGLWTLSCDFVPHRPMFNYLPGSLPHRLRSS